MMFKKNKIIHFLRLSFLYLFLICVLLSCQTGLSKSPSKNDLSPSSTDQALVPEVVYGELKRWGIVPAGEATVKKFAMPSNFDRTLQGVQMRHVCEFGDYDITSYAGQKLLFTMFPVNEKQRDDLLNVWVITDGETIVCVYKTVREGSDMTPGIYSVNHPGIIKL